MHEELAAILAAAAAAGIEVMPLKGAILTTLPGTDPARRPMADLDLLVHPGDREPLAAVLTGLGYRREHDDAPHPTHDVFLDPGGGRVAAHDGEHPDNPRRVEVHVEVKRHLWGWATDDDLTDDALARRPCVARSSASPRRSPDRRALLAHLAIHATSDLLVGRGRLVQWLDLGSVAPVRSRGSTRLPHPRVAYPSLRLAARALPRAMAAAESSSRHSSGACRPGWRDGRPGGDARRAVLASRRAGPRTPRPASGRVGSDGARSAGDSTSRTATWGCPFALARYGRTVIARTLGRDRALTSAS